MRVRDIIVEDFVNYKKPAMFINMGICDWKCCKEQNLDISICQNSDLAKSKEINIDDDKIIEMYKFNPIVESIVIGGLEPFLYFDDLYNFIEKFNENFNDDIVIYTGYYPNEISEELVKLSQFDNIIIKFGRFIPYQNKHFDNILGVDLASDNQYAMKLDAKLLKTINA